jgi:hypothetical protein
MQMQNLVLAGGSSTGNLHTIAADGAALKRIDAETQVLSLPAAASVAHLTQAGAPAEHVAIELPPGEACVVQQRQMAGESWSPVED